MLEMLMQWYRRRFSDPEAIALLVILVAGFGILFFFSGLLAPLLVALAPELDEREPSKGVEDSLTLPPLAA